MIVRRSLWTFALLVACATGCTRTGDGSGTSSGQHAWLVPGTLRIATSLTPNTLNPILSTQQIEVQAEALAFDPLIGTDPDGRDVPILASAVPTLENGGISRDGLTITYHLRRNVKWQDGAPFSSRDVAFTYHAIMNPATLVTTRHGYDDITRVDTPDAYTVVFHLRHPFGPAIHTFFGPSDSPYFILPEHLLAKYPDLNHIPFNQEPVGTGPFKVARWVRGDHIEYVANDDYFLGKPKLRRIELQLVPDENTIANELRAHEVDWFMLASPRVYPNLIGIPGIDVRLVPMNGFDAIMFNTTRAPLDDVRVRQAINLAIDKPRLSREATYGTTIPATEDIPSQLWAYDPHVGTNRPNVPKARALLDAAGWRVGSGGVRVRNGQRLVIGLAYRSDSATDKSRGVEIGAMLHDVGIGIELKGYTSGLYYGPPGVGILASGKYDGALYTWYSGIDPDDSTQLLCDQRPPNGYNWARYCTPEMDAAQRAALSHYDRPTRKRAYAVIQALLARDAPYAYLWWPRQIEAVDSDLQNFRPNGIIETWNAWQWSF
ncbi:MAG TPA: peptide ABC transporter substrate-binding protein [Candidatus Sulfotelmatobacter sp.]|nr:peptide ABC transporter substrate-binding protein [Candidatus Sulfotelmatobacter sp.]